MGLGRYTPNDAVTCEIGWKPTVVRQWKSVCLYWAKLSKIDNNRVNKRIASWGASKSNRSCKNWFYSVSNFLIKNDLSQYSDVNMPIGSSSGFVNFVKDNEWANFVDNWSRRINSDVGPSGKGRNKL